MRPFEAICAPKPLPNDEDLKTFGCGSFQEKTALVGDAKLHAIKWYDNWSVALLCTYVGAHPLSEVDRRDTKRKSHVLVSTYNQHMRGTEYRVIALSSFKCRIVKFIVLVLRSTSKVMQGDLVHFLKFLAGTTVSRFLKTMSANTKTG